MANLKYKSGSSWVSYNLAIYPVGAVYISYSSTSPASLFGVSWTPITGRFPYFNAGTITGGSNTHAHGLNAGYAKLGRDFSAPYYPSLFFSRKAVSWSSTTGTIFQWTDPQINKSEDRTSSAGNNAVELAGTTDSGSNMPAYQTFYAWRRTA